MFSNYPVVTHETHRVKLDKIGEFNMAINNEPGKAPYELFETLMSSINPFAKFVIQEVMNAANADKEGKDEDLPGPADKLWELEESIF